MLCMVSHRHASMHSTTHACKHTLTHMYLVHIYVNMGISV